MGKKGIVPAHCLLMVFLVGEFCVRAEDVITPASTNDWNIRLGVSFWASGNDGDIGVKGKEASVNESFTDMLDDLDFTAGLNAEVRRRKWLFYMNGLYLKNSEDAEPRGALAGTVSEAKLTTKQFGADVGLGYAVVRNECLSVEPYAAARLTYIDSKLSFNGLGSSSDSKLWADPIFGAYIQYRFSPLIGLYAKADVGGGASSDLTWQTEGGVDLEISKHCYARLAYRYLSIDFKNDGFRYNVATSGPQLEFGLRF